MKYLKKFENIKKSKVWVVPLKEPHFEISLKKIGMTDNQINDWKRLYRNGVFKNLKTITLKYKDGGFTWYWYPTSRSDDYTDFMGKFEFTQDDIKKYYDELEFQKDIKNFNL